MDYRDPLFSIISFLIIVAISIIVVEILAKIKQKNKIKHLEEFVEKFDFLDDKEIKNIFSENISINGLILLAMGYEKEGNYEKSLNIYLAILNNLNENEKYEILQKISEIYLKAGFLHKSRETLLEILRPKPRNKKALKTLLIVDDKLKNYDEIENIIEVCEELGGDIYKEKGYITFKKAIFENDINKIKEIYKLYPFLKRGYISFMILKNQDIFDELDENDVYEMIDIFWNLNLPNKDIFKQIKAAQKEIQVNSPAPIFELEVLKYTPKNLATLEFEYICKNCKKVFPIYEERCPNCKELFSFKVETIITKN